MFRKHPYRRQQPQLSEPQDEMADNTQNNSENQNSNNNNNNNVQENGNNHVALKQEPPLEEQFKNKCAVKIEHPVPQYIYTYSQPPHAIKKSNERNHNSQDIFYPVPTFDEAVQIYQRTGYSEQWIKEENNLQNWENNPKQFNHEMTQKEAPQFPPVVYSPAPFPYSCEMPNYPQMQPVIQPKPEMCKPFQIVDGPPMKVYYWPPNTPNNVFRPGGEPIPLKNVDVFAQISVAEDFSDLPMNNMESLRFFYNLGIKYFRLGYLLCSPLPSNPDGPVCDQDLVNQDRNIKEKDFYRKVNIRQKSFRTL